MASENNNSDLKKLGRRKFLSSLLMGIGLVASYGLLAGFTVRFIFPVRKEKKKSKMFLTYTSEVPTGASFSFTTPVGENYILANLGANVYKAFSSRCPHLGCRVNWEKEKEYFLCPCHMGIFDKSGRAIAGPPAKAKQKLKPCEIIIENSVIYAMVDSV